MSTPVCPPSPRCTSPTTTTSASTAIRWAISSWSGTATRRSTPSGRRRPVWSPRRTDNGARATTTARGLLLASGPGIAPGRRAGEISVLDVAPTLAASLGVETPAIDGIARADLVPAAARASGVRQSKALAGPLLSDKPMRPTGRRPYARRTFDVRSEAWLQKFSVGLSQALHAENSMIQDLRGETSALDARVEDVERLALITQVSAWLRHVDVPESLLISIVMPTRNRVDLVERAIDSVRRQSYANWELLVVDDASTDDTWARLQKLAENDLRIRAVPHRDAGRLVSGAQSRARSRPRRCRSRTSTTTTASIRTGCGQWPGRSRSTRRLRWPTAPVSSTTTSVIGDCPVARYRSCSSSPGTPGRC